MARISLLSLPLALPPARHPRRWPDLGQRLLPWLLPLTLAALWWTASRQHWMSEQILPSPVLVGQSAVELGSGELWSHLWISLQRLLYGLLAGVGLGALLGASLGFSRRAERLGVPHLQRPGTNPTLAWIRCSWCFSALVNCSSWWC